MKKHFLLFAALFAALLAVTAIAVTGCDLLNMTDTEEDPAKVATPAAQPGGGAVLPGTTVTLSTETAEAVIYYTIDGAAPGRNSARYENPIEINHALTIKAFAVKEGMEDSNVLEAAYTIRKAASPTATPPEGEVDSGTTVTLATATEGATIYYTTNGDAPDSTSALYENPISITEAVTLKAIAVKEGYTDSDIFEAAYTVAPPNTAARPSANPAGGEVLSGTTVTLETTTEGAVIYYTTNGDAPTSASALYTADNPLTISGTPGVQVTLKAIAVKEGKNNSSILEEVYTVKEREKAAAPTASPAAGAVLSGATVTLATATEGAAIYYTTNGDAPDSTSAQYNTTDKVTISGTPGDNVTLKAIAVKEGYTDSGVLEAVYTVTAPPYTLAFLEVSQGHTAPVTPGVTEYRVKGIPYGKDEVTITAVSAAGAARTKTVTLTTAEQTVALDGGYTVKVPAKLMAAPVPEEDDDVNINVKIAVRVIAPEGVLADKDYENTYGLASGNRRNGVHSFWIEADNGTSSWGDFLMNENLTDFTAGMEFEYDANSGLWVYEGGNGTITKNMLIRPYAFDIWDNLREEGKEGGYTYTKPFTDRPILIDEGGDVYLFYTVTLRKTISISGTVTVNDSTGNVTVSSPALYTVAPGLDGKGVSGKAVPALSFSSGASYTIRFEDFDTSTQVWFIPDYVQVGSGWPPARKTDNFDFAPFFVHDTDITNKNFNLPSVP
jgi:transcription elongation GreA/GreB family factor